MLREERVALAGLLHVHTLEAHPNAWPSVAPEGAKLPGIPESCAGGSDANPKNRLPAVGPGLVSRLPTMGSCLVSWAMGCGVWSCIPAAGRGVRFRIPGCHTWGQVWHPGLRVVGSRLASYIFDKCKARMRRLSPHDN